MWYIPLFATFVVYFFSSFGRKVESYMPVKARIMLLFGAVYDWYLVTEGQIITIFLLMLLIMLVIMVWRLQQGMSMDANARFLLYRFVLTLALVAAWVFYLWDDEVLRKKYPDFLYVPEPWSYASLYIFKY